MKRFIALFSALILVIAFALCSSGCVDSETKPIQYTCDLSKFPTEDICMGYGQIKEIADDKLLVIPGSDQAKTEYGDVVWLIYDGAWAYSVGQVVKYTFKDVKAPDADGGSLNIIAQEVYME